MFVRPEGQRLRVVVRVPLEAMRDIKFPLRGPGYLDLAQSDSLLHDAARIWVAEYLDLFEDGKTLESPRIAAVIASLPSDRSFTSYEEALKHVTGPPLPGATDIAWQQVMMDVLLEYHPQDPSLLLVKGQIHEDRSENDLALEAARTLPA